MIFGCGGGASAVSVVVAGIEVAAVVVVDITGGRAGAAERDSKFIVGSAGAVCNVGNGAEAPVAAGLMANGDESEGKKLLGNPEDEMSRSAITSRMRTNLTEIKLNLPTVAERESRGFLGTAPFGADKKKKKS